MFDRTYQVTFAEFRRFLLVILAGALAFSAAVSNSAPHGELDRIPLMVSLSDGNSCRWIVRLPASSPSALVFAAEANYSGLDLIHVVREVSERIESQTAPRLHDACGAQDRTGAVVADRFVASGTAEGRSGSRAAVAKWLAEVGFSPASVAARLDAMKSNSLVAVFGWGQTVSLPCPTKLDQFPDVAWVSKQYPINELIWVVVGQSSYVHFDRIPLLRPAARLRFPRCVLPQSAKLHGWILDKARRAASESAVLEYASQRARCDDCPTSALNDSEWEDLLGQKKIKANNLKPHHQRIQRVRWRTPRSGVFAALRTVPEPDASDFMIDYRLVSDPNCRAAGSLTDPSEAWLALEQATEHSSMSLKAALCDADP